MRTLMLGVVVALVGGTATAEPPIQISADTIQADPSGCEAVIYIGRAEMKVAGAEVNGRKQTPASPGTGAVFTVFRADRIIHHPAHSGPKAETCKGVRRIELLGNVSYRTPQGETTGLEQMIYYPDDDTMSGRGPDGGSVFFRKLGRSPEARVRVEEQFRF